MPSTASFIGLNLMGPKLSGAAVAKALENSSRKRPGTTTIELMVHPGYKSQGNCGGCDEGGPDDFSKSSDREHELAVLRSGDFRDAINQVGFRVSKLSSGWPISPGLSRDPLLTDAPAFILLAAAGCPVSGASSLVLDAAAHHIRIRAESFAKRVDSGESKDYAHCSEMLFNMSKSIAPAVREQAELLETGLVDAVLSVGARMLEISGGLSLKKPKLHPAFVNAVSQAFGAQHFSVLSLKLKTVLWELSPSTLERVLTDLILEETRSVCDLLDSLRQSNLVEICAKKPHLGSSVTDFMRKAFLEKGGEWRIVRVINAITMLQSNLLVTKSTMSISLFPPPSPYKSLSTASSLFDSLDAKAEEVAIALRPLHDHLVAAQQLRDTAALSQARIFAVENLIVVEAAMRTLLPSQSPQIAAISVGRTIIQVLFDACGELAADVKPALNLLDCDSVDALSSSVISHINSRSEVACVGRGHSLLLASCVVVAIKYLVDSGSESARKNLWKAVQGIPCATAAAADFLNAWKSRCPSNQVTTVADHYSALLHA